MTPSRLPACFTSRPSTPPRCPCRGSTTGLTVEGDAPDVWREWVETGDARLWPLGEQFDDTSGQARRDERRRITVSDAFRETVFERYDERCARTGIEGADLLRSCGRRSSSGAVSRFRFQSRRGHDRTISRR